MLLYYITGRKQFPGDESARRATLLQKIAEAARNHVDFIQLREKDLSGRELESLANAAIRIMRDNPQLKTENREPRTKLLINSRTDIAIASGADGVHLTSNDIDPQDVRVAWERSSGDRRTAALIAVSCHSVDEVAKATLCGADYAVFGPVFEKHDAPNIQPAGLVMLCEACRQKIPVIALGGVTLANARQCLDAGAAGVAGIRLFQQSAIAEVVRGLRG